LVANQFRHLVSLLEMSSIIVTNRLMQYLDHDPKEARPEGNSIRRFIGHLASNEQKAVVMQLVVPASMSRARHIANGVPENARQQVQSQLNSFLADAFIELSENAEVVNWRTACKYTVRPEISSEPDTSNDRSINGEACDKNFDCAPLHQVGPETQNTTNALSNRTARAENFCSQTASAPPVYPSQVTTGIQNAAGFPNYNVPEHEFPSLGTDWRFGGDGTTQSNDPFMGSDLMENDLELFQNGSAIFDSGYASGPPLPDLYSPHPTWSCPSRTGAG
jgi:hypothetical protein